MQRFTPEDLIKNVSTVVGFSLSPDGLLVAYSWQTDGDSQIYIASIGNFVPEQITFNSGFKQLPTWSPDGSRIAFLQDQDGDERFNIFTVSPESKTVKQVTKLPKSIFRGYDWSPDGKYITFSADLEGPHSIFTIREDGEELKRLTSASDLDIMPCWSPDGEFIVYTRFEEGRKFSSIQVIDLKGIEVISEISEKASCTAISWSRDGIRIVSHLAEPGAKNIGLLEPTTGEAQWTVQEEFELGREWSPKGRYAACVVDKDRNQQMAILEAATGVLKYVGPKKGLSSSPEFINDCSAFLFIHQGPRNPSDLFLYDVSNCELRQLTKGLPEKVDQNRLVIPEEIHYTSFDGMEIPALLYKPVSAYSHTLPPAVLRIHGGPSYQSYNKWDPTIQLFLDQGFVVLAPNFRGSTGYGNEFIELSKNDWGGGDLKDVIAAADYLENEKLADGGRIGIYGGSYGGYLMLMAMAKAPDRWACGVCLYGFTDLEVFYRSVPDWMQSWIKSEIGTPEENPEFYRERSPITCCTEINAPLLFLQGGNDVRIPFQLSMLLKGKMEEHKKPFRLKVYDDEGHGFQKRKNQIDSDREMLDFFRDHLKKNDSNGEVDVISQSRIAFTDNKSHQRVKDW